MRCVSCGADVPPQWVGAIQRNVCPGCDGPIMSTEGQELMVELSSAIARMPNDPQGLAGWLLSNYKFRKIGEVEPVERFHRAGHANYANSPENMGEVKIAPSPMDFFKNTGMSNQIQNTLANVGKFKQASQKYHELASQYNTLPDPYGESLSPAVVDDGGISQEDIAAYKEIVSEGGSPFMTYNPMAKTAGHGHSTVALTPEQVISMHGSADPDAIRSTIGNNDNLYDLSDEERKLISATGQEGQTAVMKERARRIKAQSALVSGNGSFRR